MVLKNILTTIYKNMTEDNIIYSNILTKPPGNNSANYNNCAGDVTTVGTNGGPSAYGTYDQSGNGFQWNDLNDTVNSRRGLRSAGWGNSAINVSSQSNVLTPVGQWHGTIGFRVASLLNPLSFSNFVLVDDSGNVADTGGSVGKGDVAYDYYINKYCVTNDEYALFLNSVATTDSYGLYHTTNNLGEPIAQRIDRVGASGSYSYSSYISGSGRNYGNKTVCNVSWFDCARYCNWLHNNKPSGLQDVSTTEDGAYTLNGAVSGNAVVKNAGAKYHIPTENEWYKAAYYKGGGTNAGYWLYA